MSTNQEIYDEVVTFLVKQGKRASGQGSCMYRTENGLKCAIGCLIPDELYKGEMEGKGANALMAYPELRFLTPHMYLLRNLQSAHDVPDTWYNTKNFITEFKYIARSHDLSAAILDTLDFSTFLQTKAE